MTNDNVELRLKVALISLLNAYRIPHDESWTVSKLICRMNRYPNKVLTNCDNDDKIIRVRGEEAGGGRRDLSEARKGQAEEAGSSVQGQGGRWEAAGG